LKKLGSESNQSKIRHSNSMEQAIEINEYSRLNGNLQAKNIVRQLGFQKIKLKNRVLKIAVKIAVARSWFSSFFWNICVCKLCCWRFGFIVLGLGLGFVKKKQKNCGLKRRKACVCYIILDWNNFGLIE
jgi:hypothetical protein